MSTVKETATCILLELNIERIDAVVILNSWQCIFYCLVILYTSGPILDLV